MSGALEDLAKQARWWILDDEKKDWGSGDGVGSYLWCCELLDYEPSELRRHVQEENWDVLRKIARMPLH